jgi:hypothetical protein
MSKNAKRAYVSALSALGVIILLLGIFTPLSFVVCLIIAIACWIGSGILGTYWGVKKEKKEED